MDSPLAPKPVTPGLVAHRVARSSRDRKGKGRSFEQELAAEHEGEQARRQPDEQAGRPQVVQEDHAPPLPSDGSAGHILDIEA